MRTTELLMKELVLESLYTRRHLERVPMDRLDFKPHEKSMTLGWLATFTAILPSWGTLTLARNEFDVAPPGGSQEDYAIAKTTYGTIGVKCWIYRGMYGDENMVADTDVRPGGPVRRGRR